MSAKLRFEKQFSDTVNVDNVAISVIAEPFFNQKPESQTDRIFDTLLHRHNYCEMFLCQEGELTFLTEDKTVVLSAGGAAVVPPNLEHCCIPKEDAEWAVVNFICTETAANGRRNIYRLFAPFMEENHILTMEGVPELFEELLPLHCMKESRGNLSSLVFYAEFLIFAAETYHDRKRSGEPMTRQQLTEDSLAQVYLLNSIINERFSENLSASEVAERIFVSERQLSRMIQKYYHTSFHRLLTEKRLNVAMQLLKNTAYSVHAVWNLSGFCSSASFYRCFCGQYHIRPTEVRKRNSGKFPGGVRREENP